MLGGYIVTGVIAHPEIPQTHLLKRTGAPSLGPLPGRTDRCQLPPLEGGPASARNTARGTSPRTAGESGRHHHKVRHHLIGPNESPQRNYSFRYLFGALRPQFVVCLLSGFAPMPRILERLYLRFAMLPALVFEQHVVAAVRVEGRVQVYEVYAFVRDVLPKDGQVVAVEQDAGLVTGQFEENG